MAFKQVYFWSQLGRNTAPALTIASLYVKDSVISDGVNDPILVVTPADQTITR
jgi:mannose-1-phosphate guanylyltransferase